MVSFCLEAEFIFFAPHEVGKTDRFAVSELLAVSNNMDRNRAVGIICPRESHQVGSCHDTRFLFRFSGHFNKPLHRFYGRRGLFTGDQDRNLYPCGFCFKTIF